MKINFKSIITPVHFEEDVEVLDVDAIQEIQFDAPLTKRWNEEEQALELVFKEPKYNDTNRIDIYENEAWVYTKETTVQIKKEDFGIANVSFLNPQSKQIVEINMRTFCKAMVKEENSYKFNYFICSETDDKPISYLELNLKISE
ncbi:hypothetical protein [Mycoplasmopsis verecunda]|uniref:Uncharacterized protein n=1 Tax=Mycoplasmopsis verecunda TaxID=171291 RepID=A0A1T4L3U9_9BACT|nr:hypothetical protein [Mycoplasmopsis verecunda]WPB54439.1 hypothetical protein SAM46_03055 [Mycoplasmopsis verecunda]SJZ49396.1 hypothetical protein SAMN02745154_00317 [Mycoplasmopsis verecunda]